VGVGPTLRTSALSMKWVPSAPSTGNLARGAERGGWPMPPSGVGRKAGGGSRGWSPLADFRRGDGGSVADRNVVVCGPSCADPAPATAEARRNHEAQQGHDQRQHLRRRRQPRRGDAIRSERNQMHAAIAV
jgi:hypothetical protein